MHKDAQGLPAGGERRGPKTGGKKRRLKAATRLCEQAGEEKEGERADTASKDTVLLILQRKRNWPINQEAKRNVLAS